MFFHSPRRLIGAVLVGVATACSDAPIPTTPGAPEPLIQADPGVEFFRAEGSRALTWYAAIGTSVSMGWASDGVIAASQEQAWPAQLARMAHIDMKLPLIDGTGCQAPFRAPLASGLRISGEAAAAPRATLACAANQSGVTLPAQNLAVNGATTQDALATTFETSTDANNKPIYARVLAPGQTQLSAFIAQKPKFATVELGANEVLGVRSGIAIAGATMFPVSAWAPIYTNVVNQVADVAKAGVLVGLIRDVRTFPAFRAGAELFADRAAFLAAFHVEVAVDCENSPNLLFVPVRVPVAVATGLGRRNAGAPPAILSCAGGPPTLQDFVLTPDEITLVNAQLAQMNVHIRSEARRVRFAHFELEELYGRANVKAPFSVVAFMTSAEPYGPLFSLDGMHPSAEGQRVLAEAAARAVLRRYLFNLRADAVAN
jgi:lysophospholipase L1-like esterase